MMANTQISKGPSSSGPHLRGHSINLEKVLVRSPIEGRHTKVRGDGGWGGETNVNGELLCVKSLQYSYFSVVFTYAV